MIIYKKILLLINIKLRHFYKTIFDKKLNYNIFE